MQVKAESIDRKLILHLRGELDHHAARQLMQLIARELEYALPLETELDFSGVTFMDSSGIAVALHTMQQMKQLGGKMRIEMCIRDRLGGLRLVHPGGRSQGCGGRAAKGLSPNLVCRKRLKIKNTVHTVRNST